MQILDDSKEEWSFLIDQDWIGIGYWTLFIKDDDSDYDFLDSIDVSPNVKKYKSKGNRHG